MLDLALVPWMGAWGAVIGTTVAFAYYFVRHHLLLERALRKGLQHPSPPLGPVVLRAALVAAGAAALAAAIRGAMGVAGDPSDPTLLRVAGGVPALLVAWWSSRVSCATRSARDPGASMKGLAGFPARPCRAYVLLRGALEGSSTGGLCTAR